jgi:C_GCAxxG_C_C family probable redox protein
MESKSEVVLKAQSFFDQGYACSQSVLLAFADHFKLDASTAKLIASTFGGGMGRLREKCGAVTGGFMVIGLAMGNEQPRDMEKKLNAYSNVRELDRRLVEMHGTTICRELLQKHATSEQVEQRKHHKIICRQMVGDATGIVYDLINS